MVSLHKKGENCPEAVVKHELKTPESKESDEILQE